MKNLLLTMLAFGLLSSSAFAQEEQREPRPGLEKKRFTRVVASGTNQRIGFYHVGILNEEDHQKRNDRRPGIDHKLPSVAVVEHRPCHRPNYDYQSR
jgi:hypothetical protein